MADVDALDEIFYYWFDKPGLLGITGLDVRSSSLPGAALPDWDDWIRPMLSVGDEWALPPASVFYLLDGSRAVVARRSPDRTGGAPVVHAVCGRAGELPPRRALIIAARWPWLRGNDPDLYQRRAARRLHDVHDAVDESVVTEELRAEARQLARDDHRDLATLTAALLAFPDQDLSVVASTLDPLTALWALGDVLGGVLKGVGAPRWTFSTFEAQDHVGRGPLPRLVFLPRVPDPAGFARKRTELDMSGTPFPPENPHLRAADDILAEYGSGGPDAVAEFYRETGLHDRDSIPDWVQRRATAPLRWHDPLRLLRAAVNGYLDTEGTNRLHTCVDILTRQLAALPDADFDRRFGGVDRDTFDGLDPQVAHTVGQEAGKRALRRASGVEVAATDVIGHAGVATLIEIARATSLPASAVGEHVAALSRAAAGTTGTASTAGTAGTASAREASLRVLVVAAELGVDPDSPTLADLVGVHGPAALLASGDELGRAGNPLASSLYRHLAALRRGMPTSPAPDPDPGVQAYLEDHPDLPSRIGATLPDAPDESDTRRQVFAAVAGFALAGAGGGPAGIDVVARMVRHPTTPLPFLYVLLQEIDREVDNGRRADDGHLDDVLELVLDALARRVPAPAGIDAPATGTDTDTDKGRASGTGDDAGTDTGGDVGGDVDGPVGEAPGPEPGALAKQALAPLGVCGTDELVDRLVAGLRGHARRGGGPATAKHEQDEGGDQDTAGNRSGGRSQENAPAPAPTPAPTPDHAPAPAEAGSGSADWTPTPPRTGQAEETTPTAAEPQAEKTEKADLPGAGTKNTGTKKTGAPHLAFADSSSLRTPLLMFGILLLAGLVVVALAVLVFDLV